MGTQLIEKLADLFLEQYDQADNTHAGQLAEYAAQELHLQHLGDKEPDEDKHDDAIEHVQRTALLHQPVDVVKHQGDQEDVYDILDSKLKKHI